MKVSAIFLFVWTVLSSAVSYLTGRFIGMKKVLIRKPPKQRLFTSIYQVAVVDQSPSLSSWSSHFDAEQNGISSTNDVNPILMQSEEVSKSNHITRLSGRCQSLGIDIDKLDPKNLQSSTYMEFFLSEIASDESFEPSHVVRVPSCDPLPSTHGSTSNYQQMHCNVLLSNTHVYLYTWPLSGVISINIFSCSAEQTLISLIPTIQNLVGMNLSESSKVRNESMIRWYYKLRGDRSDDGHSAYMHDDMDQFLCSYIDFDVKELVVSIDTEYQTIDIFDTIDPRFKTREQYYASLQNDADSYHSAHPELFRPDRIIYLDGILQSRYYGDAAYHEPLVHPAMFTHANPKRVAIIGGGEGATLREVLKHNTIETVTMIEIDELMVNVSRQYIPEWSDCSMIVSSTPSCFDDPRAEIFYADGIAWFVERFLNADTIDDAQLYDVIIMDALDPESSTEFSTVLYDNDEFMMSLSNGLRSDGILVTQLGENVYLDNSGLHYSVKKIEYDFMQNLIGHGFDRMEDYTEAHGGFSAEWKYKILFKCGECNYSRWHSTQASVELEIKRRTMKCIDDCTLFKFFDGATMMGYQYVSRVNEVVFCRDAPQKLLDRKELWCENRHGYDTELKHISPYALQNNTKFVMPGAEEGIADLVEIIPSLVANFSYIGLDVSSQNIMILPANANLIRQMSNESNTIDDQDPTQKRWNLFVSLIEDFSIPCIYWGSSCSFISLRSLMAPSNVYSNIDWGIHSDSLATLIREGVIPNISSLDHVIYNPFISRSHLNFQWIYEMMKTEGF